jgi:hypothetical protein
MQMPPANFHHYNLQEPSLGYDMNDLLNSTFCIDCEHGVLVSRALYYMVFARMDNVCDPLIDPEAHVLRGFRSTIFTPKENRACRMLCKLGLDQDEKSFTDKNIYIPWGVEPTAINRYLLAFAVKYLYPDQDSLRRHFTKLIFDVMIIRCFKISSCYGSRS